MSAFKLPELPSFLKPYVSARTDATRSGVEACPYCGGYHSRDSEMRACADRHSYADATYRCPRCGRAHSTLGAANACCDEEKRFERKYDSARYNSYMGGASEEPEPTKSWFEEVRDAGRAISGDDGEGLFSSFFNAGGGNQPKSSSDSGGGIFSSFFDAGGSKNDKGSSGNGGGHWFFG